MTSELCSQLGKALAGRPPCCTLAVCRGQGASSRPGPGGRSWPGFSAWQARSQDRPLACSPRSSRTKQLAFPASPAALGRGALVPVSRVGVSRAVVLAKRPACRRCSAKGLLLRSDQQVQGHFITFRIHSLSSRTFSVLC